ncbi:MAG TPA: hypothetical protein VK426_08705 [Methanobacterium sp.]|nr:hypothetical protein [Methanobacterium sp.]
MEQNRVPIDDNAKELIKKCEENEVDTSTMGACQVLLEEMNRGNIVLNDESGQSYIKKSKEKSRSITQEDVPEIVRMAFIVRGSGEITNNDIINAANRLIRRIESM